MPAADAATLVHILKTSSVFLHRMVDNLKPEEFDKQPCSGANTTAWVLGHLILTDRRILGMLGATLPTLPEGFEAQFTVTGKAADEQRHYGDPVQLLAEFDRHRQLLIDTVAASTPEKLGAPLEKPHALFATPGEAVALMALHVMLHAGQVSTTRRILGYAPVA
jgi:uncharacterized damage-inducible protein DinB